MAPARKYSEYKYGALGSRAVVWHGNAHHTAGGLTQSDLKENKKTGKIVSKKASASAKRSNNLVKAGWVTQKGVFGSTKSKSPKRRRRSKSPKRRRRSKSPKRHTRHVHVTRTSLKRKKKSPILHKHPK